MNTGALQAASRRQLIKPLPYSPPKPNAAFLSDGMTMTHFDFSHRSCGMSLSGSPRISLSTAADSRIRSFCWFETRAPIATLPAKTRATVPITTDLIIHPPKLDCTQAPDGRFVLQHV